MRPLAAALASDQLAAPSGTTTSAIKAVVDLVASYLLTSSPNDKFESVGRKHLVSTIDKFVSKGERIVFVLPAFPFKSPSPKKVLGTLPDMAEELVLRRLEAMCQAVENIYESGALLYIVPDGVVYSELLGVSDAVVAAYNEELLRITNLFCLSHIHFVPVSDLLDPGTHISPPVSPEEYVRSAPATREKILAVELPDYDLKHLLAHDVGALRTYRGYLRFLELDLDGSAQFQHPDGRKRSKSQRDKILSEIAKQMMHNGARFPLLIQQKLPHRPRTINNICVPGDGPYRVYLKSRTSSSSAPKASARRKRDSTLP